MSSYVMLNENFFQCFSLGSYVFPIDKISKAETQLIPHGISTLQQNPGTFVCNPKFNVIMSINDNMHT